MTFSLMSALAKRIRTALRRYLEGLAWRRLLRYGEGQARERGIDAGDVGRLVEEHRAEAPSTGA